MGLDRLAWRAVAARPLRSLLTIAGIALGIAVLSASLTLGAALDAAVDKTVRDLVGRADLRVSGFLESGLSPQSVDTITSTDGVVSATPVVEHRTFLFGRPNGGTSDAITVLAIDPASYTKIHDLPLVAGVGLTAATEPVVLVSQELADQDGYVVGGKLTLASPTGTLDTRVI